MNSKEITYPVTPLSALSENAAYLYKVLPPKLDRNWLDHSTARNYVRQEDGNAFIPSDELSAALDELVEAELLQRSNYSNQLIWTKLHPAYTVASGRGSSFISVSIVSEMGYREDEQLLATIVGGDLESASNKSISSLNVRVRHSSATDVEHDASSTALLEIASPTFPEMFYGRTSFYGVLTKAYLYELGVDAVLVENGEAEFCESEHCDTPHPFAPYLPPKVNLGGLVFVRVESIPMTPYAVKASPYA